MSHVGIYKNVVKNEEVLSFDIEKLPSGPWFTNVRRLVLQEIKLFSVQIL